jgi:hypothetical protein
MPWLANRVTKSASRIPGRPIAGLLLIVAVHDGKRSSSVLGGMTPVAISVVGSPPMTATTAPPCGRSAVRKSWYAAGSSRYESVRTRQWVYASG